MTRQQIPDLCFASVQTRFLWALKWAPVANDPESANIIATAGHNGLKFWDIRDPYHTLWDIPTQRIIHSLDWLPDPRCVVLSFDDGEIRIIGLLKAACDVPVTGMPCVKTQQHGSHSYYCPSSSIWSVQVSKLTGMVAYCCSDGDVPFGDTPRSKRGYISNSNQKRRDKDEKEKQPSGNTGDGKLGALSGLIRVRIMFLECTSQIVNLTLSYNRHYV